MTTGFLGRVVEARMGELPTPQPSPPQPSPQQPSPQQPSTGNVQVSVGPKCAGAEEINLDQEDGPTSIEHAFRLSVESAKAVSDESSGVEAKIIGTFAAASVIVAVAATVAPNVFGSRFYWPNLLFYLALASYAWVIIWTFVGLRIRTFYLHADPKILREDYWNLPSSEFMRIICEFAENHYEMHVQHLSAKSRSLLMILPGLIVEVLLILGWSFSRSVISIS